MRFFEQITAANIAGLALLAAGAVVTFLSKRIAEKRKGKHAELIVKCCGLAVVLAGFLLIMFG